MLELVHMFLNEPTWDEAAMERAKQIWVSHHRSLTKSLERSTADRVMEAMLGPERYVAPCFHSCHGDIRLLAFVLLAAYFGMTDYGGRTLLKHKWWLCQATKRWVWVMFCHWPGKRSWRYATSFRCLSNLQRELMHWQRSTASVWRCLLDEAPTTC